MSADFGHPREEPAAPPTPQGGFGLVGLFIERPILAGVVSLLIALAGLAALFGVEVRELPDVDNPVVSVDTAYRGATPEAIDAEVTSVIEGAVARIDGVKSISSSSRFERSSVVIEFMDTVDIEIAATDVKNAVAALQNLPEDAEDPIVVKADNDSSPIMRLAVGAKDMDEGALADLIDDVIEPRLEAVEGVAQADVFGARQRVIRVRLAPASLAARGLTVDDAARLVASASANAPSGRLRSGAQDILIRAETAATTPEEIGALRFNGATTLADVAQVEWGFQDERSSARVNGAAGAGIAILRQAQSNTVAVADGVRAAVEDLKLTLPKSVDIAITVDDSVFIKRAIEEVETSLLMSTAIVIGVIFLFLRSLRATLVPAIAIPVSLLGAVAALYLAGFSINLMTLLALVLATGLVVDDAIVVTENVERWKSMGAGKRAAALLGTRQIVFAVLSTTATLAAVFIPISFMPGQAGRLFSEFGFVLAFAVLASSVVALTLCPMLTVKFGRDGPPGATHAQGFLSRAYAQTIGAALKAPAFVIGACAVFALAAFVAFKSLPQELTPVEDRGRAFLIVQVQDGASFRYLDDKVREIEERLMPFVEKGPAESVVSITGVFGGNRAFVLFVLKDWNARKEKQAEIEAAIRPIVSSIPGATAFVRGGNSLGIRGAGQGLTFAVAGDDYASASDAAEALAAKLRENPIFADARPNFQVSQPQVSIAVDREAATALGVPVATIALTAQAMADEFRAAEVFRGDDIVDVLMSAGGEPINDSTDLQNIFLRAADGTFVPLSAVAAVTEKAVASTLGREQRRRAVPLTAPLAEGARLSDAIAAMRAAAAETLPSGMSVVLTGEALLLEQSKSAAGVVFAFAGVVVLLVLAAQFESLVSALIIMATVPFGLAAAAFAIKFSGGSLNYYSQIGLVMLIGVMAKNGILIVEFANQLRDAGKGVADAIREASIVRFRPVLMTALSTVIGGLPLVLGSGAGAESRAALGWVIVGGLGFATLFTLYLTPVAYLLVARFSKPRAAEAGRLAEEVARAPALR